MPAQLKQPSNPADFRRDLKYCLFVFCLCLLLRIFAFNTFLLGGDPEDRLGEALMILNGSCGPLTGKNALLSLMIAFTFVISGSYNFIVAKVLLLAFNAATVIPLFYLTLLFTGKRMIALIVALMYTFSPLSIRDSYNIEARNIYTFLSILALYFLTRFTHFKQKQDFFKAIAISVLAWYTYVIGGVLIALTFAVGILKKTKLTIFIFIVLFLGYKILVPGSSGSSYQNQFASGFSEIKASLLPRIEEYLTAVLPWNTTPFHFREISFADITGLIIFFVPVIYASRRYLLFSLYACLFVSPFLIFVWVNPYYMTPLLPVVYFLWVCGVYNLYSYRPFLRKIFLFLGVICFLFFTIPGIYSDLRKPDSEIKKAHTFYTMNLEKPVQWLLDNAPKASIYRSLSFTWEYFYFLYEHMKISFTHFNFPANFMGFPEGERKAFYIKNLISGADYLIFDSAYDFSNVSLKEPIFNDFVQLTENHAFEPEYSVTRCFEQGGESATYKDRITIIYKIDESKEDGNEI